jgi:hypothetical protein
MKSQKPAGRPMLRGRPSAYMAVVVLLTLLGFLVGASGFGWWGSGNGRLVDLRPAVAGSLDEGGNDWGTVRGRVVWEGDVPERRVLVRAGDPNVRDHQICGKHDIYSEELAVDPDTKGVQWALVWIRRPSRIHPDLEQPPAEPAELGQKGCVFIPHVLAVRQGQKLVITSEDPVSHNTNFSGIRNQSWNRVLPPALEGMKQTLDGPNLVAEILPMPVACNIHPWMKAYLAVFDHPYYAVTNAKGEFVLEKVPAGSLQLVSWQEFVGYGPGGRQGMTVQVRPGESTEVTVKLAPRKRP